MTTKNEPKESGFWYVHNGNSTITFGFHQTNFGTIFVESTDIRKIAALLNSLEKMYLKMYDVE
jgi:hypothetical protein